MEIEISEKLINILRHKEKEKEKEIDRIAGIITVDLDGSLIAYDLQKTADEVEINWEVVEYLKDKEFVIMTGRTKDAKEFVKRILGRCNLTNNCLDVYFLPYFDDHKSPNGIITTDQSGLCMLDFILLVQDWKCDLIRELLPDAVIEDDFTVLREVREFVPTLLLVRDGKIIDLRK